MQNKIIRFIRDYEPRTSITNDDFVQLKMLNVKNRVKQLKLSHMHGKCPSYLSKNFEKSSRSGKSNFIIPIVKNAYFKKTFEYSVSTDWYSLPEDIKKVENINKFKRMVKKTSTRQTN